MKAFQSVLFLVSVLFVTSCAMTGTQTAQSTPKGNRQPSSDKSTPSVEILKGKAEMNPYYKDFPESNSEYRFKLQRPIAVDCFGDYESFDYVVVDKSDMPENMKAGMNVEMEVLTQHLSCPQSSVQGMDSAQAAKATIKGN